MENQIDPKIPVEAEKDFNNPPSQADDIERQVSWGLFLTLGVPILIVVGTVLGAIVAGIFYLGYRYGHGH